MFTGAIEGCSITGKVKRCKGRHRRLGRVVEECEGLEYMLWGAGGTEKLQPQGLAEVWYHQSVLSFIVKQMTFFLSNLPIRLRVKAKEMGKWTDPGLEIGKRHV